MHIWNKHRSFPIEMKSMFSMSSGWIKCIQVNIIILTEIWQMAIQRLACITDIIAYNYHHTFKTHGMICDIIIFEHPFNSTKTKIINKSTFKDLMNPLKKSIILINFTFKDAQVSRWHIFWNFTYIDYNQLTTIPFWSCKIIKITSNFYSTN